MTEEVRNEAKHYKELAKLIEERLKIRQKYSKQVTEVSSSSDSNTEELDNKNDTVSLTSIEDCCDNKSGLGDSEYLKISSMIAQKFVDATFKELSPSKLIPSITLNSPFGPNKHLQNFSDRNTRDHLKFQETNSKIELDCCALKESKSEFISNDKRSSSGIPNLKLLNKNLSAVGELKSPKNDLLNINSKSSVFNDDTLSCTMDVLSPSCSFKSCLTDENSPFNKLDLAYQSLTSDSPSKLVRSNSYTLLTPSPLLVKHLKSQGVSLNRTSNSMEDLTKESKSMKTNRKSNSIISMTKFKTNNTIPKKLNPPPALSSSKKFSPYDAKLPATLKRTSKPKPKISPKILKNHSTPLSSKTSISSASPKSLLDESNLKTIMLKIENEKKRQIEDLIKKQQLEQQKLEQNFRHQQNLIFQQLRKSIAPSPCNSKLESPSNTNKSRRSKSFQIRSQSQHELKQGMKSIKLSDKNDDQLNYFNFIEKHSSRMSQSFPTDDDTVKLNCSRKLFEPDGDGNKQKFYTEEEVSVF